MNKIAIWLRCMVFVKRTRLVTATILALSLIFGLAEEAGRGPMPKWLGIEDHEVLPENPREFNNGEFANFPDWKANKDLPSDCFTFARLRYPSAYNGFGRRRGGGMSRWMTDYPDADIDFSYRLQQMTALQVNPNAVICDIEPEQLRHYPFLYMTEVGSIGLADEQAKVLRDYMLNGGFIMVDDFWGDYEWEGFEVALKQIWPDRSFVELEIDHDIFHAVFDLKVKPQIPWHRFRGKSSAKW